MATALLWFRRDLRLADHPALSAAVASGAAIVPVYVWSPEDEGRWPLGGASRWWLRESLQRLDESLRERGSRLTLVAGPAAESLPALAHACGASVVHWSRRYEPHALAVESAVERALAQQRVQAIAHSGSLLSEPWSIKTGGGSAYRVFTPYLRALQASLDVPSPVPSPRALTSPAQWPPAASLSLDAICAPAAWQRSLAEHRRPGEAAARETLRGFVEQRVAAYGDTRDRPDLASTSRLSPHLAHGELSPRQVWYAALNTLERVGQAPDAVRAHKFVSELLWREFAAHALYHFPDLPERSYQSSYEELAWRRSPNDLAAWQQGRTGVDIVDAGMRELWLTGTMHNRVRMICASFLVKNLLMHWREGARWFWDTLVDADLANNSLNWQWVAGTGPDAAPWFRIFNPATQAERFDPEGVYRHRWLAGATDRPTRPVVDLAKSRERALRAAKER